MNNSEVQRGPLARICRSQPGARGGEQARTGNDRLPLPPLDPQGGARSLPRATLGGARTRAGVLKPEGRMEFMGSVASLRSTPVTRPHNCGAPTRVLLEGEITMGVQAMTTLVLGR